MTRMPTPTRWNRRLAGLLALLGFLFAATAPASPPVLVLGELCSAHGATAPDAAPQCDHECCLPGLVALDAAPSGLKRPQAIGAEAPVPPGHAAFGRIVRNAQARAPPSV